jgi:hypothetical protein
LKRGLEEKKRKIKKLKMNPRPNKPTTLTRSSMKERNISLTDRLARTRYRLLPFGKVSITFKRFKNNRKKENFN